MSRAFAAMQGSRKLGRMVLRLFLAGFNRRELARMVGLLALENISECVWVHSALKRNAATNR